MLREKVSLSTIKCVFKGPYAVQRPQFNALERHLLSAEIAVTGEFLI